MDTTQQHRTARAVLGFMGQFASWLYGLSTEDQVKALDERIKLFADIANVTGKDIMDLRSKQIILTDALQTTVTDINSGINSTRVQLESKLNGLSSAIVNMSDAIVAKDDYQHSINALDTLSQILNNLHLKINIHLQVINRGIELYSDLDSLVDHHQPPVGLFNLDQSKKYYELASNSLAPGMALVYTRDMMNIVNLPNIRVTKGAYGILISIPFPYKAPGDKYEAMRAVGVPIPVNDY